eukprot:1142036-Alexandrium_andersonii.AAC.1
MPDASAQHSIALPAVSVGCVRLRRCTSFTVGFDVGHQIILACQPGVRIRDSSIASMRLLLRKAC